MKHLFLFCMLVWTSSSSVYSQWKHIGPFRSGRITSTEYDGSVLIGSSFATLYRTTDNGESFDQLSKGLDKTEQSDIGSFTYYKGDLYAGMKSDYPYRWDPDFEKWIMIRTNIFFTLPYILGTDSTLIGASPGLLAWSLDGAKWTTVSSDSLELISCLLKVKTRVLAVGVSGVSASSNYGREWKRVYSTSSDINIVSAFSTGDTVLLALSDGTIVWSVDGGVVWSQPKGEKTSSPFTSFALIMGKVVALSRSGMVYELNQADQWRIICDQPQSKKFVTITAAKSTLYAGTLFDGIYTSADGGRTWSLHTAGLVAEAFKKPVSDGKKIWAYESLVYDTDARNVVEIADSSVNFERIQLDKDATSYGLIAGAISVDSLHLCIATSSPVLPDEPTRFEIMLQDRETKAWKRTLCDTATPGGRSRFTGFYHSGTNLCGLLDDNRIMTSTNSGDSWILVTKSDLPINSLAGKSNFVVAGGYRSMLSTNYGLNWRATNYAFLTGKPFIIDNLLYLQEKWSQMLVTGDSGKSFSVETGMPPGHVVYFDKIGSNYILCTPDSGIYTVRKDGDKWSYKLMAEAPARILELFALEKTFFAYTENGFYTRPIDLLSDVRSAEPLAGGITVSPNPAFESINVSFPPNTSRLSIFDIRGQEVHLSSLSDGELARSLNIGNLQPGCYLIVTRGAYGIAHRTFMISR